MLRQISVFGILACGMTLVIITGGIDLSVGSVLGFTAVLFSLLTIHWAGRPGWPIPAALLAGAACGLVSGGLIARFRIQPFIATLAMMVFARGLAKWISGGQKISTAVQHRRRHLPATRGAPASSDVLNSKLLGENIAVVTLIFLVCVARRLDHPVRAAAGAGTSTPSAATRRPPACPACRSAATKLLAYGLSGLCRAVAGICQAAQEQQGDPEAGAAYELTAIAIVVIGGTSLMGGRGGIGLTLIGALTIGYLEKILSINAVGEASRLMLTGAHHRRRGAVPEGSGNEGHGTGTKEST